MHFHLEPKPASFESNYKIDLKVQVRYRLQAAAAAGVASYCSDTVSMHFYKIPFVASSDTSTVVVNATAGQATDGDTVSRPQINGNYHG